MDASMKQLDKEVEQIFQTPLISQEAGEPEEQMLMSASSGAVIAGQLKIPEIQMEIDRAMWQVDRAINARQERTGADEKEEKSASSKQDTLEKSR